MYFRTSQVSRRFLYFLSLIRFARYAVCWRSFSHCCCFFLSSSSSFSARVASKPDDPAQVNDEIYMDGRVVQKLECRPIANAAYLSLKREAVRRAAEPARKVVTLDRIVQNFKPVSDHKHNIEYREKKKAEGKKAREDIHAVQEMLFKAFEAHQYYNIKDLVRITKQPIGYLKDVMKEVCATLCVKFSSFCVIECMHWFIYILVFRFFFVAGL